MKRFFAGLLLTLFIQPAFATLTVTPITEGFVQASDIVYQNFGQVYVNSRVITEFIITNTGDESLEFSHADIWGPYFDAAHSCSKGLQPGQTCRFLLYYWPASTGYHYGRFDLNFKNDYVSVDLRGVAIQRY